MIEIVGNGLTYNRENAAPTAAFYDVGDAWTEDTPTFTQATATLKILGGDADIDNFLKSTRSNVQNLEAAVVQLKARAAQTLFDSTFVNGDTGSNPDSFDGIDLLAVAGQTGSMGANGATLTLAKLDELIDKVHGGKPDMLLMSRRSRRSLNVLARLGHVPGGQSGRVRRDASVLRRHPHRHQRLHQRRQDGRLEQRLQHHLRHPVRRRRRQRASRPRAASRSNGWAAWRRKTPRGCG